MIRPTPSPTFALERPWSRRRRGGDVVRPILPLFHCGDENRLAGYVGQQSAEVLIDLATPLLIVGAPGSGKTSVALHLAQRISLSPMWDAGPGVVNAADLAERVHFQPAIDFAREFATAIDSNDMAAFRERTETLPIWVLDDLQAIADKTPAQEELAMRLDGRAARGMATIITCRRLPTEIRGLRPSLISRTLPGLTVPLHVPRGETRREILRELMWTLLGDAPADQIALLDSGLDPELPVRALEAAVRQTSLVSRMNETPVSAATIASALAQVGTRESVSIPTITAAVAKLLGVKASEMRSGSRRQAIVRARSLAMYLARQMTDESLSQIGNAFGGRDHSTVLHAIRKTQQSLDEDTSLRRAADQVAEKLTA